MMFLRSPFRRELESTGINAHAWFAWRPVRAWHDGQKRIFWLEWLRRESGMFDTIYRTLIEPEQVELKKILNH